MPRSHQNSTSLALVVPESSTLLVAAWAQLLHLSSFRWRSLRPRCAVISPCSHWAIEPLRCAAIARRRGDPAGKRCALVVVSDWPHCSSVRLSGCMQVTRPTAGMDRDSILSSRARSPGTSPLTE